MPFRSKFRRRRNHAGLRVRCRRSRKVDPREALAPRSRGPPVFNSHLTSAMRKLRPGRRENSVNVIWGEKVINCRKVECGCNYLRLGDMLWWRGEIVRVVTVQKECYTIEKLRVFTQVTLEKKDGTILPAGPIGKREIFRPVSR